MFSKTLVKLIDYAIFPAVIIMSTKILAAVFLITYFNASYEFIGTQVTFSNVDDFLAVNSYSSLFMYITVLGGLIWVLIKAHVFHDTHIKPSLSSRLFEMNMQDLVHTNEVIFSQAFIWLSYAWLSSIVFAVNAYFGLSYWWIFYIAIVISIVSTALLALDVEREIISDKKSVESPKEDDTVVSFTKFTEEYFS